MPERTRPQSSIASARSMLEGAQEALSALHTDLILRRDEARDESTRETYDEMLTVLDSLQTEYRRRQAALPPDAAQHASYVFLLDDQGAIHPLPHRLYVALVRGEAVTPQFAGQTLRVAEWYVRLQQDAPETVVNETYGLLTFDREGRVDWPTTPSFHPHQAGTASAAESAALPSAAERARMQALLFGTAAREE